MGRSLRPAGLLPTAALVSLFSLFTWQRNTVWQDDRSLWADAARKTPQNHRVLYNLGVVNQKEGRTDEAIGLYLKTLSLRPDYADALSNLGKAYLEKGMRLEAEKQFLFALDRAPDHEQARFNLAMAYLSEGRTAEARGEFETLLKFHPGHPGAMKFLAYLNR